MAISGDFSWPSEAIDMLRRYWDAGASGSYIAGRINSTFKCALSRNAVMGKIDRLGLKRSPQQVRQTQQQSARRTAAIVRVERKSPVMHGKLAPRVKIEGEAPPKPSSSRNSRFFLPPAPRPAVVEAQPEPPAPPPVPMVPEVPAAPITILELTAASCRWPVDPVGEHGWRFCGKTRACSALRHPYCAEHRERSIGRIYRRGAA